jgi:hypothetical protein
VTEEKRTAAEADFADEMACSPFLGPVIKQITDAVVQ